MAKSSIRVVAGIIYQQDKILCARKAAQKPLAGFWEFPGGKVETGESDEQALQRELREELNIEVRVAEYFHSNCFEYPDKSIELVSYSCEYVEGDLQLVDHDQVQWLAVNRLTELPWAPADLPIVERLQEQAKS